MTSLFQSTSNTRKLREDSFRYIRSDVPDHLSESEIQFLRDHNITTIIDLREPAECSKRPCTLETQAGFTFLHMPVTGGGAIPESVDKVSASYVAMADDQMKRILFTIEHANSNVLYFCNAGKDRTGVVSALLLKRMGADVQEIVEDYMQSAVNLKESLRKFAESNSEIDLQIITPKRRYIEEFLHDVKL